MKKILLALLVLSFVVTGCSSSDDDGGNSCAKLSSINVVQNAGEIEINLSSSSEAMFYEISAVQASSFDTSPNQGNYIVLDNLSDSFPTGEILPSGNGNQTYLFYARAVCADGSKSAWIGPRTVTIEDFCNAPYDLSFYFDTLSWEAGSAEASYWQVQYGLEGFNLGTGTTVTSNTTSVSDIPLAGNTTYDFYVRSNCGATGFSSWAGPYSYYNENAVNMCLAPTNLSYTVSYVDGTLFGIETSYSTNGETQFEYALMSGNNVPGAGDINTVSWAATPAYVNLSIYQTYTFYIRAICDNGSRTAWSTMVIDE